MLLEAPPGDSAGLGGLHDLSWEHPTPPAPHIHHTDCSPPPNLLIAGPVLSPKQGIPVPGGT